MLVLERKKGQKIIIQGVGTLTICDIGRSCCRLGFEIDQSISILREELTPRMKSFRPVPREDDPE